MSFAPAASLPDHDLRSRRAQPGVSSKKFLNYFPRDGCLTLGKRCTAGQAMGQRLRKKGATPCGNAVATRGQRLGNAVTTR